MTNNKQEKEQAQARASNPLQKDQEKKLVLLTNGSEIKMAWSNISPLEMEAMLLRSLNKLRRDYFK